MELWVYSNIPPPFQSITSEPPRRPTRYLLMIVPFIVRHSQHLQWSPLSADLIAARQKIDCDRSVIGRTYSLVILIDLPFVGPSTNTWPGDLGHPIVTGWTLGQYSLTCNVHRMNAMYIYRRQCRHRWEWCVQWWHAEHRSLSEV